MSYDHFASSVYKSISLYEFSTVTLLILYGIVLKNTYVFLIVLMLLSKTIVVKALKQTLFKKNGRPLEAMNCNTLNQGGLAGGKPGFPSGHTAMAVSLFTFLTIQWYKTSKGQVRKIPSILIVAGIFCVLVPIARVGIKCHTTEQVLGGVVFGMIWGSLFGCIIDPIWSQISSRYSQDKEEMLTKWF